jgi:hypothetical protein
LLDKERGGILLGDLQDGARFNPSSEMSRVKKMKKVKPFENY